MLPFDLRRCGARLCLTITLATYAIAVLAVVRSGLSGWIFAVSEPLYWPSLLVMLLLAGQDQRAGSSAPWCFWRRAAEADLRRLCQFAMQKRSFLLSFWLNWVGALVLPVSIVINVALPSPVRLLARVEIASTRVWRLPALWCANRRFQVGLGT